MRHFFLCAVFFLLLSTQCIVCGHPLYLSSVTVQGDRRLEQDLQLQLHCDDDVVIALAEIRTSNAGHVLFKPPMLVKDAFLPEDTLSCTVSDDLPLHNPAFFSLPFPFPRRRQPPPAYQPPYYQPVQPPATPLPPATQVPTTVPPPRPVGPRIRISTIPIQTEVTTHFRVGPLNITLTFSIGMASPPPAHRIRV